MTKKEKPPRTTPFTARELIVELSKCDPHSRVYFVLPTVAENIPLMRGIDAINPKSAYCGGVAVTLKSSTVAAK